MYVLRMSAHRLAIETGRHVKPKISKEERICKNCALEEVEDESHFLLNQLRLTAEVWYCLG